MTTIAQCIGNDWMIGNGDDAPVFVSIKNADELLKNTTWSDWMNCSNCNVVGWNTLVLMEHDQCCCVCNNCGTKHEKVAK